MTWSISLQAPSRAAAKLALTVELPRAMLHQKPHARDFDVVRNMLNGAIDVCIEGAIRVTASGHLNGQWVDGDIPEVTGVSISSMYVSSEVPKVVPPAEVPLHHPA